MSGIEIVGVVLGALPLIISAIEHIRSASSRLNLLANFETEYRKTLSDVKDEELIFRLQLKKLLVPLVKDDVLSRDDLEALMVDARGPLWKDGDVDKALKERLGDSCERYLETIEEVQCLAWQLLKPLSQSASFQDKLANASTSASPPKEQLLHKAYSALSKTYKHEAARLKFASTHERRTEILDAMHKKIKNLTRLLDMGDQVATLESSRRLDVPPRAVKALIQYWKHADRVYALIHQALVCTCKQWHCAHLWLQHRTSPTFEFRMLVLFTSSAGQCLPSAPWQQQGLQIRWVALENKRSSGMVISTLSPQLPKAMAPPRSAMTSLRSGILSKKPSSKTKCRPTVSFGGISANAQATATATASRTTLSSYDSGTKKPRMDAQLAAVANGPDEISNLCQEMEGCGMHQVCIGSLTDSLGDCRYIVSSQPEQKVVANEISLEEVLRESHRPRLRRSERFQIALKVASSHLQLHSTPWARKQWTAKDVLFPCTGTTPPTVMFDRPFVSADFNSAMPTVDRAPSGTERSFACLGIMLLELLFGTTLENHELWLQLGMRNKAIPLFRLMVARQWADEVQGEAGPEYSAAVMWTLVDSPSTLEGEQWRQDLADRVVLPLQNCNEWIHARSTP